MTTQKPLLLKTITFFCVFYFAVQEKLKLVYFGFTDLVTTIYPIIHCMVRFYFMTPRDLVSFHVREAKRKDLYPLKIV